MIFTRRIRCVKDSQNGPWSEVNQNKAIDELEEIAVAVERNTENVPCTFSMPPMYRSLLRQIN